MVFKKGSWLTGSLFSSLCSSAEMTAWSMQSSQGLGPKIPGTLKKKKKKHSVFVVFLGKKNKKHSVFAIFWENHEKDTVLFGFNHEKDSVFWFLVCSERHVLKKGGQKRPKKAKNEAVLFLKSLRLHDTFQDGFLPIGYVFGLQNGEKDGRLLHPKSF